MDFIAAVIMLFVGAVGGSAPAPADEAVIVRVIDGDTVDVRINEQIKRIRLLNVDTPETKDPNAAVECLGPEAFLYLDALLRVGSAVTLEYDTVREDRYGRTLAAIVLGDGRLANAELARAGFSAAVNYGGDSRFFNAVRDAQKEADVAQVGLHSQDIECTAPAQAEAAASQLQYLEQRSIEGQSSQGLTLAAFKVGSLVRQVTALASAAESNEALSWSVLSTPHRRSISFDLREALAATPKLETQLRTAAKAAATMEKAEARAADDLAKAEARRVAAAAKRAADLAEAQRVTAEAEAERSRVEQAAIAEQQSREAQNQAPPPAAPPAPATSPVPAIPPAAGGDGGYTGCRYYGAGGTSLDDQGRRYTKIPCP